MPSGSAAPHTMGLRRRCGAAARTIRTTGMCSVTPKSHPAGGGHSDQWGLRSPVPGDPLHCPHGVLPPLTVLWALQPPYPDLWLFAHSCLLMCLLTKSYWDRAWHPCAALLIPWLEIDTYTPAATSLHPNIPSPQNRGGSPCRCKLPALALPKETECCLAAEPWLLLAARLACLPPAPSQAKFFVIPGLTPAARNAGALPTPCMG